MIAGDETRRPLELTALGGSNYPVVDPSLSCLFIQPPLTDPTTAYHSLSYLIAPAVAAGYREISCLDANIEALNFLARADQVGSLLERAANLRSKLEQRRQLSRFEQLQYRTSLLATGLQPGSIENAILTLKSPDDFYDFGRYRRAVTDLKRWIQLLCVERAPGMYTPGFDVAQDGIFDLSRSETISSRTVIDAIADGFRSYLDGPFAKSLVERPWQVIGLSISYAGQLPIAIAMARRIRELAPSALLVLGGTETSDVAKYASTADAVRQIFRDADLLVVGEGETALLEILSKVGRHGSRDEVVAALRGRPGIVAPRETAGDTKLPLPSVRFENVALLPAPRYDVWSWERYWSPEPVVLYSPTRGCYWNKCTFCDYGLNLDRPTSPSRERPVETVVADLRDVSGLATVVYFAVDAMSPAYVRKLSAGLIGGSVDISWAAELRLERNFPQRRLGAQLADSGCVAVSFGYESGSQRILDLIDKGVNLEVVPDVLRELSASGIAAQMMGFTGFPSETDAEARQTFAFLDAHRDLWTTAGIGEFALTPGSIVARRPEEFGIELLPGPEGADVRRILSWREVLAQPTAGTGRSATVREAARAIRRFPDDRPFVGGIDSAHSLLYFARFGRQLVDASSAEDRGSGLARTATPFASVRGFATNEDVRAARERAEVDGGVDFQQWLHEPIAVDRKEVQVEVDITPTGEVIASSVRDKSQDDDTVGRLAHLLLVGAGVG